jgi:hypothetical protein
VIYPKPPQDSGLGIHGGANAWFPLGEDGPAWAIGELKAMGFTWVKLLDVDGSSLECVRECKAAGIEPVIRLYRHWPNPGTLADAPKTKEAVPALVSAGARYFEVNNEPNVNWEWRDDTMPPDAPEQVARDFMVDADYVIACGGIPLIVAMSPGGHWDDMDFLTRMLRYLKAHWGNMALCAIACHNAALNHPLDYPYDAINQSAENAGQELLDPGASNGWLKYQAVHDLVSQETGLDLPVLSTEGGIWPGEAQDPRYPAVTPAAVTEGYRQIRADMRAGKYPDWYLCTGFWLMANRGMGNPDMSFEYQTWYNSNGTWIDSVAQYKADGAFVRPPYVEPEPPADNWLTDQQIADVLADAGFTGSGWTIGVAVVLAESGGRTDAVNEAGNTPPSRDRGLWQLNDYWHPEVSDDCAFDALCSSVEAYRISDGGEYWGAWAAYNAGTYLDYWDRAEAVTCGSGPSEEDLKNAAWNAMLVNYNPDAALVKYAAAHDLGVPLCNEYKFTVDCAFYVGQVFIGDGGPVFCYCKRGDWGNVKEQEL